MFRITKTFRFEAAHHLGGLPPEHQCARVHGHSYLVRVEITGADVGPTGMLVDFGDLTPITTFIGDHLDHRDLNHLMPQPTAENLARWLFLHWADTITALGGELAAVRVHETATCWAEYRP